MYWDAINWVLINYVTFSHYPCVQFGHCQQYRVISFYIHTLPPVGEISQNLPPKKKRLSRKSPLSLKAPQNFSRDQVMPTKQAPQLSASEITFVAPSDNLVNLWEGVGIK